MKIVTVCGMGIGSSLILKITVESALKKLDRNKDANIEHWDMGTIKGQSYDLLVTTEGFRSSFESQGNVVYIDNVVDVDEVSQKLEQYFEKKDL